MAAAYGNMPGDRERGVNRRDVDDRPAAGALHRPQRVLRAQPGALEIDAEDAIPFGLGHLGGVEVGVHAGVVDQHVERAVTGDDGLNRAPHVGLDRDVRAGRRWRRCRPPPARGPSPGRPASSRSAKVDRRAFGGELLDDRPPDAAGAAGDERNLSVQSSHGVCGVILYGSVTKPNGALASVDAAGGDRLWKACRNPATGDREAAAVSRARRSATSTARMSFSTR